VKATFDFDPNYCPSCGNDLLDEKPGKCYRCSCVFDYATDKQNSIPVSKTVAIILSDNPINYSVMGKYAPSDHQWLDVCVAYDKAVKDTDGNFVFELTTRQANRLYFELTNNVLAAYESSDTVSRMVVQGWVEESWADAMRIGEQVKGK
jgi:hypothetical protein